MIVLGADTHKRSHAVRGLGGAGELKGEETSQLGARGLPRLSFGHAGSAGNECGRSRTAGMSRAPLSGF